MHADIGDRILIRGRAVGQAAHGGEVTEIRGRDGAPPYLVRFDDGREVLVFPGPDCVIEHAAHA